MCFLVIASSKRKQFLNCQGEPKLVVCVAILPYLDPPAAELSAERPRRQKLLSKIKNKKRRPGGRKKRNETQQTLPHAETYFREIPPISCCRFLHRTSLKKKKKKKKKTLKKTLPGKLETPPTAKGAFFDQGRHVCQFGWSRHWLLRLRVGLRFF